MSVNLIEWIESITATGRDLMLTEQDVKDYPVFAVNRGVSQHIDTLMFAAEMNKRPGIKGRMHYLFLKGSIKKQKRFGKWAKKTDQKLEDVDMVANFYQFSREKSLEALTMLTPEQLEVIKAKSQNGGVKNGTKQKRS